MKNNKYLIIVIIISILLFSLGCSNSETLEKNTEPKTTWRITKETLQYSNNTKQVTYYKYDKNGNLYLKRTKGCDTFYVYKNGKEAYYYEIDTYKKGEGFKYTTWSINVYQGENKDDKINEIITKVGKDIYPAYTEIHYFDEHNRQIKYERMYNEIIEIYEYTEFNKYGDYTKCLSKKYENEKLIYSDENSIVEYKYENGKKVEYTIKFGTDLDYYISTYYEYDDHGNIIQEKTIDNIMNDSISIKKYEYETVDKN